MSDEINKDEYMVKMADNLLILRTKLKFTQSELAERIGVSRQTLLDIENIKRPMSWSNFVALLAIFREDCETNGLLNHFGIFDMDLSKFLTSSIKMGGS